jgi:hypothetical protein
MKKITQASVLALSLLFPSFAFAADNLQQLFCTIGSLVMLVTPMIVALALLGFFWGLAMYMFSLSGGEGTSAHSTYGAPASPQGKQTGRTVMFYGIITLFVMVSIWGIVNILQQTFDVGGGSITPPSLSEHGIAPPTNLRCTN